jgi:hypothetical protein
MFFKLKEKLRSFVVSLKISSFLDSIYNVCEHENEQFEQYTYPLGKCSVKMKYTHYMYFSISR